MTEFTWLVAALILAAILDLGLMAGLRYFYRLAPPKEGAGRRVLFGRYSPALSWVGKRKRAFTPLQLPPDRGRVGRQIGGRVW